MSTDVTVQGSNIHDVLQKLGRPGSWPSGWIVIDAHQDDFGRGPIKGFRVRSTNGNESFNKIVPDEKALLRLIMPIWRMRFAEARKAEKDARQASIKEARKAIKVAAKALAAAKKHERSL